MTFNHQFSQKNSFWATVCKTVRPMLSVHCPVLSCPVLSCLSCLSVTFVHCGQTAGQMKMKVGMQVGLVPGHIELGGDPAPPPLKGHSPPPNFRPISVPAKWLHGSKQLDMKIHNSSLNTTLLAIWASSLMNILPFPTKFQPSPKLAILPYQTASLYPSLP